MYKLLKESFLNKNINELDKLSIFYIYIFFSTILIILTLIYCNIFINKFDIIDVNYKILLKKLEFEYGSLVYNIYNYWEYSFVDDEGIKYHLKRLPIFPILIVLLTKISKNIFFIFICKSLILFSVLFLCVLITSKSLRLNSFFFCLFFLPFLIPYNLHVVLNIHFADSIIAILLPSLFILLFTNNSKKYFLISFIFFLLYLTKNSVLLIVMILPIVIFLIENDKLILKSLPILGAILAIISWGIFGIIKTGGFPFGSSHITSNSKTLNEVVLNNEFKKYYPKKSVDLIPKKKLPNHLTNEWQIHDHFTQKNKEYFQSNLKNYIQDLPIKLRFIFFNIHKDSVHPKDGKFENPVIFSHIINRFFFNISILVAFFLLFKKFKLNFKNFHANKIEIYFLSIIVLALIPNIVGWATSKHLVSIQIISIYYLLIKFEKLIYQKK